MALDLIIRFFCITGLLRSRNLHLRRVSSLALISSSGRKGRGLLSFRISISFATTSMYPVGCSGFMSFSGLFLTVPFTLITYSRPSSLAFSTRWGSSTTIWVLPYLSLRSMKVRAPISLNRLIHPVRMTSCPIWDSLSSPQVWVLIMGEILTGFLPADYKT